MTVAVLAAESQSFSLKYGSYLIRGPNAAKSDSKFNLVLAHNSIEDKHALICVDNCGINIYDLSTASGTYVNEKRLDPLSKFTVDEEVKIRFGDFVTTLQLCNSINQHQSSGFHDVSNVSPTTTGDTTDSFIIPETQFVSPAKQSFSEKSVNTSKSSFNTSVPETQDLNNVDPVPAAESPCRSASVDPPGFGSQFVMSSQDFKECCNDINIDADGSENILGDMNWLLDNISPETAKEPANKVSNNFSTTDNEELVALHLTSTTASRCESQLDLHLQTQTPDLFDGTTMDEPEEENDGKDVISEKAAPELIEKNQTENDSSQKVAADASLVEIALPNNDVTKKAEAMGDNAVSEANKEPDRIVEVEIFPPAASVNVQPLPLSDKENLETNAIAMSDLEPTQVFVKKKDLHSTSDNRGVSSKSSLPEDSDLLPTQVFVPKKQSVGKAFSEFAKPTFGTDSDLEPTQIFVPKNPMKNIENDKKIVGLNSTMVSGAEGPNKIRTLANFFEGVDDTLTGAKRPTNNEIKKLLKKCTETPAKPIFSQKKQLATDAEVLMNTPRMIADGLNEAISMESASKRTHRSLFEDNSDDEDSLTDLLTRPRNVGDFDELMESINKNKTSKKEPHQTTKVCGPETGTKTKNSAKASKDIGAETERQGLKEAPRQSIKTSNQDLRKKTAIKRTSSGHYTQKDAKRDKRESKKEKSSTANYIQESDSKSGKIAAVTEKRTHTSTSKAATSHNNNEAAYEDSEPRQTRLRRAKSHTKGVENDTKTVKAHSSSSTQVNDERPKRKLRSDSESTLETQLKAKELTSRSERKLGQRNTIDTKSETSESSRKAKLTSSKEKPSQDLKKREPKKPIENFVVSKNITKILSQGHSSEDAQSDIDNITNMSKESKSKRKSVDGREEKRNDKGNQLGTSTVAERTSSKDKLRVKLTAEIAQPVVLGKRTRATVSSNQLTDNKRMRTEERPTASELANNVNEKAKQKRNALKILFTMVSKTKSESLLKQKNSKWEIANNLADCDILVMDEGKRTVKFLVAVAKGIPVVTTKWLEAVNDTGVVSIEKNFFKDSQFEQLFGFNLLQTLNKANNAKLLKNYEFFCTPQILPAPKDMKVVISCAGGRVLDRVPSPDDNRKIYVISSEADRRTWHGYRRKNPNIFIINTEAIMQAIMRYDVTLLQKHVF